jgi:hypothetical protein
MLFFTNAVMGLRHTGSNMRQRGIPCPAGAAEPGVVAFNGKAAAAAFYNKRTEELEYGLQPLLTQSLPYSSSHRLLEALANIGTYPIGVSS